MIAQLSDLEDFFENGEFALHIVGHDGTILCANKAELDLLGYTAEEYVGRNIIEFHTDRLAGPDILARLSRGEKLKRHPAHLYAKDGSIRHVEITSSGRFCNGEFVNTRCLTVDVTEARLARDEVHEVERNWRHAIDALPAAIYTTDAQGRITYFNEAAVAMAGRRPQLGSDSWCVTWRLFNLDGTPLPHDQCPMAVALRENRPVRGIEALAERPDGTRVRFLPYPTPLQDSRGRMTGAINLLVDVTEQRAAEADAAHLGAIVVSSTDAVVSKTLDGVVTSWNAAAERMFGYRANEMIGQSILRIIPPERHEEERGILAKIRKGERIEHYETVRLTKDERPIDVSLSISPIVDRSGKLLGAAKVARDITQRKQAEETQRLLLGELNHRVKNTLATVQSIATQTLRRTVDPADFVPNFLGRVQALAGAHTLLTQTNWLGAELGSLIRDQVIPDVIPDERIVCSGPEIMLPTALALHIALVMHELGTNARKHGALSVARGRVTITWSMRSASKPALELTWSETGGPPLYAEVQPRRGFGTILIERSMQAIEGGEAQMHVKADGISWSFNVPLPSSSSDGFYLARPQARPGIVTEVARSEPGSKRILLVEDEPLIALDIAGILTDAGFTVVGPVYTLDQAVSAAATAVVQAALLDANLGGKPVDELASVLTRRNIPFAFVTGYGRENLPQAFASAPALTKPFSPHAVVNLVNSMFSRAVLELRRDSGGA